MERTVLEAGADFLVPVKRNTPALHRQVLRALGKGRDRARRAATLDSDHGRIERRAIEVVPISPPDSKWPHTHTACRVTRERELVRRGEVVERSREEILYVASFAPATHSPEDILRLVRGHWGIENRLHHRKDRSMDEDRNRAAEHGIGRIMCGIRSIAALVLGGAKESLAVVQRRFSRRTHLILGLLFCRSVGEWERSWKPYRPA